MLLAPHVLAGLVVAKYEPNILPAALAAITVHFVLDTIPHTDMVGGDHVNLGNILLRSADLALTVFLFVWLVPKSGWAYSGVVAIFAVLPDLISLPVLVYPKLKQVPVFKQYHHWHTQMLQYSWSQVNWYWGLLPQAILLGSCIYFLVWN